MTKTYPFKAVEVNLKMMIKNQDDLIHSKTLISTAINELEKHKKEQLKIIEQCSKQLKKIDDKPSQMKRSVRAKLNRAESKVKDIDSQLRMAAVMMSELS